MPAVKRVLGVVGPAVTDFVRLLVDGFKRGRETVNELAPTFERGMGTVRPLLTSLGSLFQSVFTLVASLWENVLKPVLVAIAPLVGAVLDTVGRSLKTAMDFISGVVNALSALLRGDWSAAWQALAGAVTGALEGIQKTVRNYYEKVLDWGSQLGKRMVDGFMQSFDKLGSHIMLVISQALLRAVDAVPDTLKPAFAAAADKTSQMAYNMLRDGQKRASVQASAPANAPDAERYAYGYISRLKDVFKNDPQVNSDCTSIASSIMHHLGQNIKGSVNAGVLEQNAIKAGYQKVSGDEIKPGDLIVWTSGNGKTYGAVSGKHAGVAAGAASSWSSTIRVAPTPSLSRCMTDRTRRFTARRSRRFFSSGSP